MHISEIYRKFIEINRKSIERLSQIKLNSAQAIFLRHGANNINKPTILCKIFQKRCLAFHANNYHCLYLIRLTHYKPLNHLRMCILAVCLRAFSTEVSVAIRFSWCASTTTSTGTAKIFTRLSGSTFRKAIRW